MPTVTYIDHTGAETVVDLTAGTTLKDGALMSGVEGIVAECGGNAMCATCHVYVEEPWSGRLPEMSDIEDDMLEGTADERLRTSRLSCQIVVDDSLDGIVVRLPATQA